MKYAVPLLIITASFLLPSCKKESNNPLLGEWRVDSTYYKNYTGGSVNNYKKSIYTDSNRTIIFEDNLMWHSYENGEKREEFGTYFPDKNEIIRLGLPHLYSIEGDRLHIYNYNYKNNTKLDIDTSEMWLRRN
jgi:hypothetical protein